HGRAAVAVVLVAVVALLRRLHLAVPADRALRHVHGAAGTTTGEKEERARDEDRADRVAAHRRVSSWGRATHSTHGAQDRTKPPRPAIDSDGSGARPSVPVEMSHERRAYERSAPLGLALLLAAGCGGAKDKTITGSGIGPDEIPLKVDAVCPGGPA